MDRDHYRIPLGVAGLFTITPMIEVGTRWAWNNVGHHARRLQERRTFVGGVGGLPPVVAHAPVLATEEVAGTADKTVDCRGGPSKTRPFRMAPHHADLETTLRLLGRRRGREKLPAACADVSLHAPMFPQRHSGREETRRVLSRWTGPAGTVLLIGVALCGPLRGARAANGEVTTLAIEEDGLQARIVADAPMFYAVTNDPKQAPFIGFARAGTPVSEYKVLEGGAYVVVGMPFLRPDREGTVREGFQDQHSEDYLHVFLPAQVGKTTMAMAKGESSAAADQYGLFREISVQPGQPGFAFVQCGKTRILERRGPHMRVAAEFDAGELHGWIDAAPPGARDRICDTRALRVRGWMRYIPDLPHGYDRVSDAITAPKLLSLAKSKGALFRPEKSAGGLACKGWRFSPSDNPRRGKLMLDKEDLPADYKEISSRYAIGGSVLSLLHPVSCRKDGTMITAGCFGAFSLVRFYSDRAIVVRGSIAATGYGVPKVVGFRTSTTQTWYFHRNDCERALATESTRPVDCCWEIPSAGK